MKQLVRSIASRVHHILYICSLAKFFISGFMFVEIRVLFMQRLYDRYIFSDCRLPEVHEYEGSPLLFIAEP